MQHRQPHHGCTPKQNLRGFTLLEIVVSLAILAILGLVLSQSFITSVRTNTKGEITQEVGQNGNLAVESVSRMILNATAVVSACTTDGVTSSDLVVTNTDGGQTTIGCVPFSTILRIASSSGIAVSYLTSDALTLTGASCDTALTFTCQIVGDNNKKIHMSFYLSQKNADAGVFEKASSPFELTITTRN